MKQQTFRLNDDQIKALNDARDYMGHTKQRAFEIALDAYLKHVEKIKKERMQ